MSEDRVGWPSGDRCRRLGWSAVRLADYHVSVARIVLGARGVQELAETGHVETATADVNWHRAAEASHGVIVKLA
jgi:hypothetical protein